MKRWLSINGTIVSEDQACISPFDRGFLLGDGLFETLLVKGDKVYAFEAHWQRFQKSAFRLNMRSPVAKHALYEQMIRVVKKHNFDTEKAVVRWTLSRGQGPRGLKLPDALEPNIVVAAYPYYPLSKDRYWKLAISHVTRRNEYSPSTQMKTLNYLDAILAHDEAIGHGYNDAILCNTQNELVCSTMANLFWITDDHVLVTAAPGQGVLPGITRSYVLTVARHMGLTVREKALHMDERNQIQEGFLTNSLLGIMPIQQVEDKVLTPHRTLELRDHLNQELEHALE